MSYKLASTSNLCDPTIVIGTRAAIQALSGSYDTRCHYVVTDYNDGNRLTSSIRILLHAVNGTTLSMGAEVSTPYDTTAWIGEYDIATGQLTKLQDNLGNIIHGPGAVQRFDWGNTRYTHVSIEDDATLLTTIGQATYNIARLTVRQGSSYDLVNHSAVPITDVVVERSSTIVQSGTVQIQDTTFSDGAVITFNSTNGLIRRCRFDQDTIFTISAVNITLQNSIFELCSNGLVYTTAVPGGYTMTIVNSTLTRCTLTSGQSLPSVFTIQGSYLEGVNLQLNNAGPDIDPLQIAQSTIAVTTIRVDSGPLNILNSSVDNCLLQFLDGMGTRTIQGCEFNQSSLTLQVGTGLGPLSFNSCRVFRTTFNLTKASGAVNFLTTDFLEGSLWFDATDGPVNTDQCWFRACSTIMLASTHSGMSWTGAVYSRTSFNVQNYTGSLACFYERWEQSVVTLDGGASNITLNGNYMDTSVLNVIGTLAGAANFLSNTCFSTTFNINGGTPTIQNYEVKWSVFSLLNNTLNSNFLVAWGSNLNQGAFSISNCFLPYVSLALVANLVFAHRPLATTYPTIV